MFSSHWLLLFAIGLLQACQDPAASLDHLWKCLTPSVNIKCTRSSKKVRSTFTTPKILNRSLRKWYPEVSNTRLWAHAHSHTFCMSELLFMLKVVKISEHFFLDCLLHGQRYWEQLQKFETLKEKCLVFLTWFAEGKLCRKQQFFGKRLTETVLIKAEIRQKRLSRKMTCA